MSGKKRLLATNNKSEKGKQLGSGTNGRRRTKKTKPRKKVKGTLRQKNGTAGGRKGKRAEARKKSSASSSGGRWRSLLTRR